MALLSRRSGAPSGWRPPDGRSGRRSFAEYGAAIAGLLGLRDGQVTATTAHSFKGDESAAVIVIDAVAGAYPLIHPTWPMFQAFGDSLPTLTDAERRLFYVAVSRAETHLDVITTSRAPSPFLDDINRRVPVRAAELGDVPMAVFPDARPMVEIRVFNAYRVEDQLYGLDYRWSERQRYWYTTVDADLFSKQALASRPWLVRGVRVEVVDHTGALICEHPPAATPPIDVTPPEPGQG